MNVPTTLILTASLLAGRTVQTSESERAQTWLDMTDQEFASEYADACFDGSLEDRQRIAWMVFARVNQLIADAENGGMSGSGRVPSWMAWPTDPDTFGSNRPFKFGGVPRATMMPSAEKGDLEAGRVATADPDGANEEVNRNKISYDYLIESGLTTKLDVAAFFAKNDRVEMPVGSIELKASWLQVTEGSPAPTDALTFQFEGGTYWWRGLHIMLKMRTLPSSADLFYTEEPSWFWTTFEFNGNPGVSHVRESLVTQRAPLPENEIAEILKAGGLSGFGLENFAPNGTQIRFTQDGAGKTPVILGHTDMEDFAGAPNIAQAQYWTQFEASCHSCHATASYNPTAKAFFPFSVPTGALTPSYRMPDSKGTVQFLGQGYKSLDFMWPIAFQAQ